MSLSNAQYEKIIRQFDAKKLRAEREASERAEYISNNLAGYRELEEQTASSSIAYAKRLIAGDESAILDAQNEIDRLSLKKKELLTGAGYPEDYLEAHYECPICKDTGYVGTNKCKCFKKAIVSLLYSQSNIENLIYRENFDTLSYDYQEGEAREQLEKAVKASHDFIDNFENNYQNIIFYGTVGTGKSFLSGCIAKELLDKGHSVIYFSASELFEILVSSAFASKETIVADMRYDVYECDLLIIDDLGTEIWSSAASTQFFALLSERFLRRKSILISTNLIPDDMEKRYDKRIFSRIRERFSFYRLAGADVRKKKKFKYTTVAFSFSDITGKDHSHVRA